MRIGPWRAGASARRSPLRGSALVALVTITIYLVSCGEDDPAPPQGPDPFFPLDLAGFVEVRNCRPSVEHFPNVRVLIDSAAATAYTDSLYPFAEGTVCVKVIYNDDNCTQIASYDAMRKGPPGTAPASGDWEWQTVNANGAVETSGQVASCISCHTTCTNGRDFTCTDP